MAGLRASNGATPQLLAPPVSHRLPEMVSARRVPRP
jgi:hypothetical protein